jgi:hypothetical protein
MNTDIPRKKSGLHFFDIVEHRLLALAAPDVVITTERGCRSDSVLIRKDTKTVEVGYEPYCPPFCFVKTDAGSFKRVEKKALFPAGRNLATGSWSETLFSAHEEEVRSYLDWLVPVVQEELRS